VCRCDSAQQAERPKKHGQRAVHRVSLSINFYELGALVLIGIGRIAKSMRVHSAFLTLTLRVLLLKYDLSLNFSSNRIALLSEPMERSWEHEKEVAENPKDVHLYAALVCAIDENIKRLEYVYDTCTIDECI